MLRIGHGFDVHAFDQESTGPIKMGGVSIPYDHDFLAHSDGDVLLHAICDALLGALALGDIGKHFPDTAQEFYKIDSKILLRKTYQLIQEHGYSLVNLDATIIAQAPKFANYIVQMRESIAACLNTQVSNVSVKATTSEKLGFTGRKEGIAVEAVVLIKKDQE
ncbi:2-C-methyl-D-erythritol 2,4-cyclodiphosphate synthase [Psittacicella melopsittaci]|uniref:2-C-methyl-D-erythritol 2,4-cyclodiphosphate synthase n=1 Tax=Psittacicella melopsittaci TaxID=2028576 RepID=A0A3A1Y5N6_9GAMM|nr:2-C-methyl-D-erythritol 2,4-cyclodiphosphate synthase [Psittacicella melopsittaci]RIY32579.1 2-C-methyl-D-erythritol 2,4-cyclodiphosphate synthase [Psittacicella melopsittaci]